MSETPCVFLQPGELFLSGQPRRVKTVLGSCVAVTIRARNNGLACMVHCQLPNAADPFQDLPPGETCRYVDSAIPRMLGCLARHGASPADLEVKLFGGADSLRKTQAGAGFQVGQRNVAAAVEALAAYGLSPVSSEVGGSIGRLIEFDTASGVVLVKRLNPRTTPVPEGEL